MKYYTIYSFVVISLSSVRMAGGQDQATTAKGRQLSFDADVKNDPGGVTPRLIGSVIGNVAGMAIGGSAGFYLTHPSKAKYLAEIASKKSNIVTNRKDYLEARKERHEKLEKLASEISTAESEFDKYQTELEVELVSMKQPVEVLAAGLVGKRSLV